QHRRRSYACRRSRRSRARGLADDIGGSFGVFRAELADGPRWTGFLTCGSWPAPAVFPGAFAPARGASGPSDGPWTRDEVLRPRDCASVTPRLQWRDRVGFAPASRGRRGERQIVRRVYHLLPDRVIL